VFVDPANTPSQGDMDTSTLITRQSLWAVPLRESLLPTCRQVLYLLPGCMYRLLFAPTGELAQAHVYQKGGQLSEDLFLRLLLEREKELTDTFLTVEVVIGYGKHILIPDEHFEEQYILGLARTMLDDAVLPEELYTTPVPTEQAKILSLLPNSARYVLGHYLPQSEIRHVSRFLVEWSDRLPTQEGNSLLLLLGRGEGIIVARKEGQLALCNSYPMQTPVEVLYFVQAVLEATGMKDQNVARYVMGETDGENLGGESIWSYLEDWQIPGPDILGMELPQHDAPYWLMGFLMEIH